MKLQIIIFFLFSCFFSLGQTNSSGIELECTGKFGDRDLMKIEFYLKNNSEDTIVIHKPKPLNFFFNQRPPVPLSPEFYELIILSDVQMCESAPYFMNSGEAIKVKGKRDFLILPPNSQQQILIDSRNFELSICDDQVKEIKFQLRYDFDERYLKRTFFDQEIGTPGQLSAERADELFDLIQRSYRGKLSTEVITIKFDELKSTAKTPVKKEIALRKAKREFGIDIAEAFFPDYLDMYSGIKINVDDNFKEEDLADLQNKVMKALWRGNSYYSMIMKNGKIEWLVGSKRRGQIHQYNFQDILDSLNLAKQEFLEKKKNSEIKDYEIHSTYWHLQNIGVESQKYISKHVFLILKDPEGQFYGTSYRDRLYPRSFIKLTPTKYGFEYTKKSYSSFTDDQKYTYEVLENSDMVFSKSEYVEKGFQTYQGYFIKVED